MSTAARGVLLALVVGRVPTRLEVLPEQHTEGREARGDEGNTALELAPEGDVAVPI